MELRLPFQEGTWILEALSEAVANPYMVLNLEHLITTKGTAIYTTYIGCLMGVDPFEVIIGI